MTDFPYPPNWIMFTWKARIFAIISGSASILSSALVISIIWRSEKRLSPPYHRIILFMCFWDIVSSSAIVLTVLPMPADIHDIYKFSGKAYGNKATCEAQALAIVVGQAFAVCANCVLNIYYLCTLRYGTSQEKLNRIVLPIALAISCLLVFPVGFLPLFFGLLNPRPHEPYCLIGSYPNGCNHYEDIECISRVMNPRTEDMIIYINSALIGVAFFSVFVSLLLVFIAVFKSERTALQIRKDAEMKPHTKKDCEECKDEQQDDDQLVQIPVTSVNEFRETLTCGRVALMYIAAFFITWIWTVISLLGGLFFHFNQRTWDFIGYAKLLCLPLQGCINSLIFIYHKAQIIRKRSPEENISFLEAIRRVIISPKTIPPDTHVSSIEMIEEYILKRDEKIKNRKDREAHHEYTEADLEIDIDCHAFESEKQFDLVADVSSAGIDGLGVDKLEKYEGDLAHDINFQRHEPPFSQSSDGISYDKSTKSWYSKTSLLSGFSDAVDSPNSET